MNLNKKSQTYKNTGLIFRKYAPLYGIHPAQDVGAHVVTLSLDLLGQTMQWMQIGGLV
jgi:hypothetical protein